MLDPRTRIPALDENVGSLTRLVLPFESGSKICIWVETQPEDGMEDLPSVSMTMTGKFELKFRADDRMRRKCSVLTGPTNGPGPKVLLRMVTVDVTGMLVV